MELRELLSQTSDVGIRRLVHLRGLLAVGVDLATLVERTENFVVRLLYLAKPTTAPQAAVQVPTSLLVCQMSNSMSRKVNIRR